MDTFHSDLSVSQSLSLSLLLCVCMYVCVLIFFMVFSICSIMLQEEASLMMTEQGTDL